MRYFKLKNVQLKNVKNPTGGFMYFRQ